MKCPMKFIDNGKVVMSAVLWFDIYAELIKQGTLMLKICIFRKSRQKVSREVCNLIRYYVCMTIV